MAGVDGLSIQQNIFINEFIRRGFKNPADSYLVAYPKCKRSAADACASKLLKTAKIREKIEKAVSDLLADRKAYLEHEIFNYWYVRMSYDPTEIIGLDGGLKISEDELRSRGLHVVIDGIVKKKTRSGDQIEYKLADRDHAADKLNEYIQMIKPQTQSLNLAGKDGGPISFTETSDNLADEFSKILAVAEKRLSKK